MSLFRDAWSNPAGTVLVISVAEVYTTTRGIARGKTTTQNHYYVVEGDAHETAQALKRESQRFRYLVLGLYTNKLQKLLPLHSREISVSSVDEEIAADDLSDQERRVLLEKRFHQSEVFSQIVERSRSRRAMLKERRLSLIDEALDANSTPLRNQESEGSDKC